MKTILLATGGVPWTNQQWNAPLRDPKQSSAYVVLDGEAVIGGAYLSRRGNNQIIDRIAVDPRFQNEGAEALLLDQIKSARPDEAVKIIAYPPAGEAGTSALYRSLGFEQTSVRKVDPATAQPVDQFVFQGKTNQMPVNIRWMIRRDLPEVLSIDKASQEFPWSEEEFIRQLQVSDNIGMVAETNHGKKIVGFMIYENHKNHLNVLNFAVEPEARREGVGNRMVEKLLAKLIFLKAKDITIQVRESNLEALKFLREMGFRSMSLRKNPSSQHPDDSILMQYSLGAENFTFDALKEKDHFSRLEVGVGASPAQVAKAFTQIKKEYALTEQAIAALEESVKVLSNPSSRRAYLAQNREKLLKAGFENKHPFNPAASVLYDRIGEPSDAKSIAFDAKIEAALLKYGPDSQDYKRIEQAVAVLSNPEKRAQYIAILVSTKGADQARALIRFFDRYSSLPEANPAVPSAATAEVVEVITEAPPLHSTNPKSNNFYHRLGVAEHASFAQIIDGWITARARHSDESDIDQINEAYRVLREKAYRNQYDAIRQRPISVEGMGAAVADLVRQIDDKTRRTVATEHSFEPEYVSFYELLGVFRNSHVDAIVDSYERLSKTISDPAEARHLAEAFRVLRDPTLREMYNQFTQFQSGDRREQLVAKVVKMASERAAKEQETEATAPHPTFPLVDVADWRSENLYQRLGIGQNARPDQIEKAFLSLVVGTSPDEAKNYQIAYDILIDPELRMRFDQAKDGNFNLAKLIDLIHVDAQNRKNLAGLDRILKAPSGTTSLETFVHETTPLLPDIALSPGTAVRFLQGVQQRLDFDPAADLMTHQPLVRMLEVWKYNYARRSIPQDREEFVEVLRETRALLNQRLIDVYGGTPEGLKALHSLYPLLGKGDLVTKQFEDQKTHCQAKFSLLKPWTWVQVRPHH